MTQEQLPNLLLDQSKDFFWMVDADFQLIYANKRYLHLMKEITGVEVKQNESIFLEGLGEVYIEKWKAYYTRALTGESFQTEEHFYHPQLKEIQYSHVTFNPVVGDDLQLFAVACQSKDITLLVKHRSEANLLMDASLDVFCTINELGNFAYVSAATVNHWGYLPEELIGKPYMDLVLEEDVPKTNEISAFVQSGQDITSFFNRYKKKDGSIAYNFWSTRWDNQTKLMYAIARNGKEKIQQEEKILQSEQRFKALVQEGSDLIGILDVEGNYVYVSPTSTAVLGMEPEEFIGRNAFEFIHPDDIEKTLASLQKINTENKVMVEPFRFQNHNKEWKWVETVLTNMLDNPWVKGIVANSRDITEKVSALKQIEANELFNRTVLESSPDCLKVLDKEGRLQFMNVNGLCQMEIDDFATVKNKNWWTLWGSENEAMVNASLDKALAGETAQFTAFCPTVKGTHKWWDVMVSPVGKAGEPVQQLISVSRDITRQKAEEEKLKAVSAIANIGYWRQELERNTLSWTDEIYKIWGRDKENFEVSYEHFLKTIHPADLQFFERDQALTSQGLASLDHIHRIILPDNKVRWVHELGRLVKDVNGKAIAFEGTVQDITQQKEEEQRLKLFESVITNTSDAVLITEAEPFDEPGNRIIYINEAFTKMTGYKAEEILGKTPRILQGPNSNKEDLAALGRKIRNWEPCELTIINYKKNGEEFWIHFSLTPVADEKGWYTHWISIERDVSEQKQKELENELLGKISLNFRKEDDLYASSMETCKTISEFGKFDFAELWLPNMENNRLHLMAAHSTTSNAATFYEWSKDIKSFLLAEGLPGIVWQKKSAVLWSDITHKDDLIRKKAAEKAGIESALGIPLFFNQKVVAVLVIGTERETDYLKKHIRLFEHLEQFIGSEINRKKLENDLRYLYNAIPDLVCMGDVAGRFLKINKAGCELLGYNEEEILYHHFEEFIHPADKDVAKNELQRLNKGETTFNYETRFLKKTGQILWLSWFCNVDMNEGLIYATAKNITEEKKLRELNIQASSMARIGSWEIDLLANKLFWSEMVHQLHETDPKSFVPNFETAINFYKEDFRQMVQLSIEKSIRTGDPFDFEAVVVTADKRELWVRAIGIAEFIDGVCTRIYGSFQDINDRKEAEIRLQSLADNLPGVVFQYLIYPDGTDSLKYVTKGSQEVWGFAAEEVIQNNMLIWDSVIAGGEIDKVQKSIADSIAFKTQWNARWKYVMPGGEIRTHLGYGSPNFLADGTVLFNSVILDVTSESKKDELLEKVSMLAKIGSWEFDLDQNKHYWTDMMHTIFETDPKLYVPNNESSILFLQEDFRPILQSKMKECVEEGITVDFETLIVTANKNEKWIRVVCSAEMQDGKAKRLLGSTQDITERKKVEEKLIDSEQKYRQLALELQLQQVHLTNAQEVAKVGSWETDLSNFKVKWSDEMHRIFGTDRDNFVATHEQFLNCVHPLDRDKVDKAFADSAQAPVGSQSIVEHRIITPSGELKVLEERWKITYNDQEEPLLAIGICQDITERKKSEEDIRDSEEKRRLIMSGALDAIICIDTNGTVTFWNPQAEVIFGWKEAEVLKKDLAELIIPQSFRKYHNEGIEHYLKTGEGKVLNILLELSAIKRSGEEFPIELTVIPIKQGGEVFFCAFIRDITERKKAEVSLLQSNERFEKVTQATNDAIWDWDILKETYYRSRGIERFFGKEASGLFAKSDLWTRDHFHPDDLANIKDSFYKAMANPLTSRWEWEYRVINELGKTLYVIDRAVIIRNSEGKATRVVGAMTDISEQTSLTIQLSELNKTLQQHTLELERSNEELEQFAFVASHDLQEPLRMISSFMELLQRRYGNQLDTKAQQYIGFATEGAEKMKQIILDLLEYSRAGRPSAEKEKVDLNDLLSEFKVLRRKLISEKAASVIVRELPTINTYRAAVTQILHCLIDNALKYAKANMPPIVEIDATEKDTEWEFSIKDNGIGIDPQFFDKIFVIFQRLHNKDEYSGTGIGLSIAKRHVEFLGGRIWLTSTPGEGSIFYFTIPKTKKDE